MDDGSVGRKETVWPDVKTKVDVAIDNSMEVTGPEKDIVEEGTFARMSHHLHGGTPSL